MPRIYKKQTERVTHPHAIYEEAVKQVLAGKGLREVAKETGLSKSTLARKVVEYRKGNTISLGTNFQKAQVFSTEEEGMIEDYVLKCADLFYNLSTRNVRTLAYETAKINNIRVPKEWEENKMAGEEWRKGFMRRHPNISLRTPEATSMARASAFNRHNIGNFFKLLEETLTATKATAFSIFKLDESGFTTVQKPPKILAPKGKKQIGQCTSAERGVLVTVCAIVGASGNCLPPAFIFPRVNFKEYMLHGAPEGSLGLAYHSGWMTGENFLKVMEHFIKHVRPSAEKQVVLVMDNHESHLYMPALEYAKMNYCHVVTLPPHTSQKTQPLDRSVFGSLKAAYNRSMNSWIMRNPARPVTIYNVAEILGDAWLQAVTPRNIKSGFEAAGIWPFNSEIFSDDDFSASEVTNRLHPSDDSSPVAGPSGLQHFSASTMRAQSDVEQSSSSTSQKSPFSSEQSSSTSNGVHSATLSVHDSSSPQIPSSGIRRNFTSPMDFQGLPKADARKVTNRGRKRGKTMIATSTPEMDRMRKALKTGAKQNRKSLFPEAESDSDDMDIDDVIGVDDEGGDVEEHHNEIVLGTVSEVSVGAYVLCEFSGKKSKNYYIGCVNLKKMMKETWRFNS